MSDKKTFEYPGETATVSWDGALCIQERPLHCVTFT